MTLKAFYAVLEDILGVPHGSLEDSDNRDTVGHWSSIADVKILSAIASEFNMEPDIELMEAETIGDLIRALDNRGAFSHSFQG